MASALKVKPTHKAVKSYYAALATYADQSVEHEGALRSAFQNLLSETGRKVGWTLIPELSLDANGHQIRPDGTFRDEFTIERGYWEAKDTDDDLEAEIKKKIKRGYRLTNTIFEDTREARLYQDGKLDMIADLRDSQQLCDLHSLAGRLLDSSKNLAVPSLLAVTKRVPVAFTWPTARSCDDTGSRVDRPFRVERCASAPRSGDRALESSDALSIRREPSWRCW